MALNPALKDAIRDHDAEIRRLQDYGLEFSKPGYVARLMAKKQEMAVKYSAELRLWEEINRTIWPALFSAYLSGGDLERDEIRRVLKDNRIFAWGVGWDHANYPAPKERPADATDLRNRLAMLAMKDGDSDWRDEIVTLDNVCAAGRKSGLDTERLLREAAQMSSDLPRGGRPSFRATLLARADRLARER